mmetsp:Transcript_18436/g.24752  ORF Transcript_18436/g.24752 Transcript_18436/m.24752 type:complete len:291 (-) Transcript_18436:206-1078(-)
MGQVLGLGPLLDLGLELFDRNLAHLGEECTVDGHRDVQAQCHAHRLEQYARQTHPAWHHFGFCQGDVPEGGHEEHRDAVDYSRCYSILNCLLSCYLGETYLFAAVLAPDTDSCLELALSHRDHVDRAGSGHGAVPDEVVGQACKRSLRSPNDKRSQRAQTTCDTHGSDRSLGVRHQQLVRRLRRARIPIAVVQARVVGLIKPLPKDRVHLSRWRTQHTDNNWDIGRHECTRARRPHNSLAAIRRHRRRHDQFFESVVFEFLPRQMRLTFFVHLGFLKRARFFSECADGVL